MPSRRTSSISVRRLYLKSNEFRMGKKLSNRQPKQPPIAPPETSSEKGDNVTLHSKMGSRGRDREMRETGEHAKKEFVELNTPVFPSLLIASHSSPPTSRRAIDHSDTALKYTTVK
jgi:hypothetical protein